ncbi:histone-lysine N-methyltransferase family member SUVH9-like [Oryza glaberrima]|uniref:histone-lysine N-methyltransferase family member SUVH9-like n=1 Tax=Oryza glaberrima TaxID=4538 RepID=UPI00224C5BF2|nr:histone-lysine N-methyltransferase family member SUVH9-like [Oryza glaberrima]XP_052164823.1 histone-lysine N-methyltransferase family member SUVH9-like [Oryza glaberrima]XP_052164824.1 histone-lysine N-methyltransferase family member SUVH9-like [Oryza glaberrima]XP_052164825.1 histone-lysine N-methyltransferase family member SUVH9-like [Oryza glaberrima]XP_052164826.1 histone-lysine N-methyltransferase family member SUVH9-like [Oryza glaberrima]XP_052164828.1 histone-lysine N-methyltransfe
MASPPPPPRLLTPKPDPDAPLPPLPYPDPNLAQSMLFSAQSPQAQPQAPPPHIQPPASVSAEAPSGDEKNKKKKKRARASQEMVRITNLSIADHLHYRSLVRRARLTFEALRAIYQRQDLATAGGIRNRFDLRASSKMLSKGLWMHRDIRTVGSIPGLLVGDSFFYRAELCVLGLHTAPQAGIGYIPASIVDQGHPVATSIVSSGGYLDDEDSGDVLVYSGSGGRLRNRLDHSADQTLQRGNLALHYSCHYGIEVRVIRGHACDHSPSSKVYVYDGLYRVVTSTFGPGKSGRDVCKFKLVRIPGQDDLGSKAWHTAAELKDALDSKIRPPKYISLDIAKGKEPFRVPLYNKLDDDRSPLFYDYIACPDFPTTQQLLKRQTQRGCHCAELCGSRCSCERKNRGADGPVYTSDGILLRGRPLVYECGPLCGCPMTCPNRVTQQGMKHRLEVFRSKETGWGVRTLDLIQPGAFICEYAGDVLSLDSHSGDAPLPPMEDGSSIIDPTKFPERWREWGDASVVYPDRVPHFPLFAGARYRLDVSQRRNVACYISHSCSPNVFLQYVIRGNEDESYPHMMVFAMETIPPMRDLSIDYGLD